MDPYYADAVKQCAFIEEDAKAYQKLVSAVDCSAAINECVRRLEHLRTSCAAAAPTADNDFFSVLNDNRRAALEGLVKPLETFVNFLRMLQTHLSKYHMAVIIAGQIRKWLENVPRLSFLAAHAETPTKLLAAMTALHQIVVSHTPECTGVVMSEEWGRKCISNIATFRRVCSPVTWEKEASCVICSKPILSPEFRIVLDRECDHRFSNPFTWKCKGKACTCSNMYHPACMFKFVSEKTTTKSKQCKTCGGEFCARDFATFRVWPSHRVGDGGQKRDREEDGASELSVSAAAGGDGNNNKKKHAK